MRITIPYRGHRLNQKPCSFSCANGCLESVYTHHDGPYKPRLVDFHFKGLDEERVMVKMKV